MLLSSLSVLAGFIFLIWGADRFVLGASSTARNLGVAPMIIGLTIVGFGTSAPEMLVSAMAALDGQPGLAVGNALGSNIANISLILGASALITPLSVRSETLRREFPLLFAVMLVVLLLIMGGTLSRLDGTLMLIGMGLILYWTVGIAKRDRRDPMAAEYAAELPPSMSTARSLIWLAVGLAVLLVSSRLLVWGAVNIAHTLGVSDLVIGLTIVAIGTSLPELAASIMSALKGEHDIAIGNVIGSNIFNTLVVLGIPGILRPGPLPEHVLTRDYPFSIALTLGLFAMAYGFRAPGRITRAEGALLLTAFVGYQVLLLYTEKP